MRITDLKINHYKSIKEPLHITSFSNLSILVGPNNAGKTNVFDAIQTVIENPDEERLVDEDVDIELTLHSRGKEYFLSNKKRASLEDKEDFLKVKESFVRISDTSSVYKIIPEELGEFKENYPEKYESFSRALSYYFKDVEISEELFILSVDTNKKKRSVKRMGEGFKRLFVILFYIFHPQYTMIFIDEPELHLHPSIIRKFLALLKEKGMGKQIFLTTHHPTFVQADHLSYIWRVARNENANTSVYKFAEKDVDINRFVQEINDDNSAMLFSDKVLLVEGVSDRIFMSEMLHRFYRKDKDIKVVYTGGKGTTDLYAALCDMFRIPYAVMLDSDAINSPSLKNLKKYPEMKKKTPVEEKKRLLKEKEIFILQKDLERVYPRKYKRRETKPLSALYISKNITRDDLKEKRMSVIKEILETI